MEKQMLFSIGQPTIEGASADLLGGKGYGLWKMKQAGINVPPAWIISTDACREYMADPEKMMAMVKAEMLPVIMGDLLNQFCYMPLVAVRSGAKFSMPGMMDTILNVGLDGTNCDGWTDRIGKDCTADSWGRLVEMFGNVVNGIERKKFDKLNLTDRLALYEKEVGGKFPMAADQLLMSIEAVFKSWNNERAVTYRLLNRIPHDIGTAVVIQAMVFGNFNEKSATGVAFSRNYSTGENEILGDWIINGQGEDVVAGIRNTEPLSSMIEWNEPVASELMKTIVQLEKAECDMVDVEFTIQDGKLFILQCRKGKRTAQAAIKIAVDLVAEKMIGVKEALASVTLKQFLAASRASIPAGWLSSNPAHGVGIPASNGCASGVAVFSSVDAVNCTEPCILIAEETTPDDIAGMNAAVGILTSTGGATSHAAVVARGMDKVCVVGCTSLKKTGKGWTLTKDKVVRRIMPGSKITLDGSTGSIWVETAVPVAGGTSNELVSQFLNLISDQYDFFRTCVSVADMEGAKKILMTTYMLDRQYSGAALESAMADMLGALKGRETVIDLREIQSVCREADAPMEFIWGPLNTDAVDVKIKALIANTEDNLRVLELGLEHDQITTLKENGFTMIPSVKTLPAMLNANGLCVADFDQLLKAMNKEDVMKIIALKKAAGEEIRSFNIVEEVESDDLGRNAVYALSGMQAAQSLLRAE